MQCKRGLSRRIMSLRRSVKHVHCDKTEERSVQIFIQYERAFSRVFWEEEIWWGVTPSTWNFESVGPRWSEIADFQPIFTHTHSASAVTPSAKSSIYTYRKSTTCFPMSLRLSSYVASKWLKKAKKPIFI